MNVLDRQLELDGHAVVDRFFGVVDQFVVERLIESVILADQFAAADARWHYGIVENAREVKAARLPVLDRFVHLDQVDTADHIVELAESELRHQLANLLGDKEEIVDDVLRLAV